MRAVRILKGLRLPKILMLIPSPSIVLLNSTFDVEAVCTKASKNLNAFNINNSLNQNVGYININICISMYSKHLYLYHHLEL